MDSSSFLQFRLSRSICASSVRDFYDHPASVNTTESAQATIRGAPANGTDPNSVKSNRYDSVGVDQLGDISLGTNDTLRVSSSWHNGSIADPSIFSGIDTTDSDMLLLRNLRHRNHFRSDFVDLNSYRRSFGTSLVMNTTIKNGQVVELNDAGFRALVGVPSLQSGQSVALEKSMALVFSLAMIHIPRGPENLSETVDEVRNYYSTDAGPMRTCLRKAGAFFSGHQGWFAQPSPNVNVTRSLSDLHQLRADYFDTVVRPDGTKYVNFDPIPRYTLSDDSNSPISHFIHNTKAYSGGAIGTGSAGNILSSVDSGMNNVGSPSLERLQRFVVSFGFIPLIVAAILIAAWISKLLIVTRALAGVRTVEDCYGGLRPYWGVVCPMMTAQDALLAWECFRPASSADPSRTRR
ncbi:hypothetical protein Moror_14365 [Moniliophthora roreri MCA 2997]|uniref:Uncharacterized protein n=1 Tax=Moniliophthora roreri (strain MCA 2997) TaxID=1381753 RepID=V2XP94_MONRO|nr:hypothetical protein Moror_14365 [Moniliophthora roreri MCA 2997]